jgi:hypothetical protein
MPSHAFKNRAATYLGQAVTVLRGANPGDIRPGTSLEGPHFLVVSAEGEKLVAPVAEVEITPEA